MTANRPLDDERVGRASYPRRAQPEDVRVNPPSSSESRFTRRREGAEEESGAVLLRASASPREPGLSSSKYNRRPDRLALTSNAPHSLLHLIRKRREINPPIVLIQRDKQKPLLNPLHRRSPLPGLRVVNPYAELEEDPDEVGLVADAFEEELFEEVAGFEVLAIIEQCDAADESGIVNQFQVSDRS